MKSSVETLSPTRVKMTVEVPYEELKPSIEAALKAIGSQISVPGFRPGKVPAKLIEQRVGRGAVLQEAVNEALPEFYGQAVTTNDLRPLGQPEVDLTTIPVNDGDDLVFTAELDVRPAIELPDFSAVEVVVDPVDDASVEEDKAERLDALRKRFGTLVGVDRPAAEGDFVSIDLRGVIGGEEIDAVTGVSYEIGTKTMLEGLDDALIGMTADEVKMFEAPLAGGEHVGQNASITVTVQSVKERQLPDLDDDFAQLASQFDTLGELEEDLRGQARQAKVFEQGVQARDKILEKLLEDIDVPVPEALIEAQVDSHFAEGDHGDDENTDEHRAEVEADARKALRSQLLLDTIAEKNEVEVGQQELIEYLVMTAQQYGMEPAQLAQAMDEGNQIGAMAAEVARRKALASVMEQAKVTDTAGEVVDLSTPVDDAVADEAFGEAGALQQESGAADGPGTTLADQADAESDAAGGEVADGGAPAGSEPTGTTATADEDAPGAGESEAAALTDEAAGDAAGDATLADQADAELDAATGESSTDPVDDAKNAPGTN